MSKEEGGGGDRGPAEAGGGQGGHQAQYVGPYRLEKTLGKGQTGWCSLRSVETGEWGMLCYITTKEATPLTHSLPNTICWSNRLYSQHQSPPVNLALINNPWNWFLQIITINPMITLPTALCPVLYNLWGEIYLGSNGIDFTSVIIMIVLMQWSCHQSILAQSAGHGPGAPAATGSCLAQAECHSPLLCLCVFSHIEQEYFEKRANKDVLSYYVQTRMFGETWWFSSYYGSQLLFN